MPETAVGSFAGVANPWQLGRLAPGERVLDLDSEARVRERQLLRLALHELDVVISDGVIDLIPDKDAVFAEISRVLAPGGRIQIADVTIQNPVSAEGRRNIDLWTG